MNGGLHIIIIDAVLLGVRVHLSQKGWFHPVLLSSFFIMTACMMPTKKEDTNLHTQHQHTLPPSPHNFIIIIIIIMHHHQPPTKRGVEVEYVVDHRELLKCRGGNCLRTKSFQLFIVVLLNVRDFNHALSNPSLFQRNGNNKYLVKVGKNVIHGRRICLVRGGRSVQSTGYLQRWSHLDQEGEGINIASGEDINDSEKDLNLSNIEIPTLTDEDNGKCNTLPRLYVGTSHLSTPNKEIVPVLSQEARVRLSPDQTHYLTKVMRFFKKRKKNVNVGPNSKNVVMIAEKVVDLSYCARLFDGVSGEWLVVISDPNLTSNLDQGATKKSANRRASMSKNALEAECLVQLRCQNNQSPKRIQTWVVFAPIKKQRLKLLVEKCTELGADLFCPVTTDHTDATEDIGTKEMEKLKLVACEASEQCERLSVPKLTMSIQDTEHSWSITSSGECLNLHQLLEIFVSSPAHENSALLICRERRKDTMPILEAYSFINEKSRKICLILVGPEGGWSEEENALFDEYRTEYPDKILGVSLGSHLVLRAETAAMTAVASHTLWIDSNMKDNFSSICAEK